MNEIAMVTQSLETDQVVSKQTDQQLVAPWQASIQVGRRKGNMKEKGNLPPGMQLPQVPAA